MANALAEKGLVEEVAQLLTRGPGILQALVADQSRETLDRRPGENAWSQTEILAHLADFEVICFQARLDRILTGEPFPSVKPDQRAEEVPYAAIDPRTSLDVFSRERARSLERIRKLTPDQLGCRARHNELGEVTLGNFLAEWAIHDLSHIRQLVVVNSQTFLPKIGPWRSAYSHLELRGKV
jgi:DinB family protein